MKRILSSLFCALVLSAAAFAQDAAQSEESQYTIDGYEFDDNWVGKMDIVRCNLTIDGAKLSDRDILNCFGEADYNRIVAPSLKKMKQGMTLMIIGGAINAAGLLTAGIGFGVQSEETILVGSCCTLASLPFLGSGIPIYCVNRVRCNDEVERYNKKQWNSRATLSLHSGSNGIGLAINF